MKNLYKLLLLSLSLLSTGGIAFAQASYSFSYTGSVQSWTVPAGVTVIAVTAKGAMGGLNSIESSTTCGSTLPDRQGYGACVSCNLAVTPGQVLNIYVGQKGVDGTQTGCSTGVGGIGGYNGGGNGRYAYGPYAGGGGGGATDIRIGGTAIANRVVVAAGGGGAGANYFASVDYERGGDGGGVTGEDGYGDNTPAAYGGGSGGSATGGGAGGLLSGYSVAASGTLGTGGAGTASTTGGGGGGGYYGGGGGCWGGGGGGSSYTDAIIASSAVHTRGCNSTGDGSLVICPISVGVISGTHLVCIGTTTTLSESGSGGTWSSSATGIATVSSTGVVSGVTPGTATIFYTVSTPCGGGSATYVMTVTPLPTPFTGGLSICRGSSTTLGSTPLGGMWSSSNTAVASIDASTGFVSGLIAGTSTIVYSSGLGCSRSAVFAVRDIVGPSAVCLDSTISLTVPGVGGLTWTSHDTTIASVGSGSGVVTGLSIGTSMITYSGTGCFLTHSVMVGAYAPIVGSDSVCVGGSGYLTNIVGGGTWSSTNVSVASISFDSGLVYGYIPGFDTIIYRLPAGCMASRRIQIIGPPSPSTGTLATCAEGGTTTISNPTPGGVWSSADNTIATVNPTTGVITGVAPDTVGIIYTIPPGCSRRTVVTINPLPEHITGKDTVCPGILDTLHSVTTGGIWSSGTTSLATVDTLGVVGIVVGHTGGNAIISYKLPLTGCLRKKTIYVYPGPNPTVTYNWLYNTFYTPNIWPAYQWYDSLQGLIPFANSPSLAALRTDYYWVVVTDTLGCRGASGLNYFNIKELGVGKTSAGQIKIYPNPTDGMVKIESAVRVRAVISDMAGKAIMQQADAKELDVSMLANGAYMITLYDDDGQMLTVQKLVKE
jgi:uncharacterized protein YjdB